MISSCTKRRICSPRILSSSGIWNPGKVAMGGDSTTIPTALDGTRTLQSSTIRARLRRRRGLWPAWNPTRKDTRAEALVAVGADGRLLAGGAARYRPRGGESRLHG